MKILLIIFSFAIFIIVNLYVLTLHNANLFTVIFCLSLFSEMIAINEIIEMKQFRKRKLKKHLFLND